jgi:hypothetical protein
MVVSARAGGIDFEFLIAPSVSDLFFEDNFCRWRSADVAKADEKDAVAVRFAFHEN